MRRDLSKDQAEFRSADALFSVEPNLMVFLVYGGWPELVDGSLWTGLLLSLRLCLPLLSSALLGPAMLLAELNWSVIWAALEIFPYSLQFSEFKLLPFPLDWVKLWTVLFICTLVIYKLNLICSTNVCWMLTLYQALLQGAKQTRVYALLGFIFSATKSCNISCKFPLYVKRRDPWSVPFFAIHCIFVDWCLSSFVIGVSKALGGSIGISISCSVFLFMSLSVCVCVCLCVYIHRLR